MNISIKHHNQYSVHLNAIAPFLLAINETSFKMKHFLYNKDDYIVSKGGTQLEQICLKSILCKRSYIVQDMAFFPSNAYFLYIFPSIGRSRQLQGLAVAMIKLWERSSIAKIALKRGVQLTTSERMAEDLKVREILCHLFTCSLFPLVLSFARVILARNIRK